MKNLITTAIVAVAAFSIGIFSASAVHHSSPTPSPLAKRSVNANVTMSGTADVMTTLSGPDSAIIVGLPNDSLLLFNLADNSRAAINHKGVSNLVCEADPYGVK